MFALRKITLPHIAPETQFSFKVVCIVWLLEPAFSESNRPHLPFQSVSFVTLFVSFGFSERPSPGPISFTFDAQATFHIHKSFLARCVVPRMDELTLI